MTLKKLSIALSLAAAASLPLYASVGSTQATVRGATLGAFSDAEASVVSTRLYRALLGREPDADGLAGTISEVRAGRARQRIDVMVASSEFVNNTRSKSAEAILEQFYQGLLGRSVDPAGTAGRLRNIQQRRYTDEIVSILSSQEFRNQLGSTASTPVGSTAGVTSSDAVNCQERVVELIRDELTGFVLITFDAAQTSGSSIVGTATDVSENGRRLSYRCDVGSPASFNYDDGRRARSAANEGEFANDVVRSCQGEIRTKVQQQMNTTQVVFESAGLMPAADGTQAVRGLGMQGSASNGSNFIYSCDMRGTQILVSTVRRR